jgi:hypothetical protein
MISSLIKPGTFVNLKEWLTAAVCCFALVLYVKLRIRKMTVVRP